MTNKPKPTAMRMQATRRAALTTLFTRWFTNGTKMKLAKAAAKAPKVVTDPTAFGPIDISNMGTMLWSEEPANDELSDVVVGWTVCVSTW